METLVLPAQDQLSQHHYWQKQRVFPSPCSRARQPDPLLSPAKSLPSSAPSSPLYRSAQEFASPAPLARSLSGAPENAPKGRAAQENAQRIVRGSRNPKPANPRSKMPAARVPETRPRSGFGRKSEARRKEEVGSSPPKITILQRPQSKEAAMLDLAKITGLPLSAVYAKNGLTLPEEKPAKAEPRKEPGSVRFREDPRKGQLRKSNNSNNNSNNSSEQTKKKVVKLHEENSQSSHAEQSRKTEGGINPEQKKAREELNVVRKAAVRLVEKARLKVSSNNPSAPISAADLAEEKEKSPEPPSTMMFSKSFEGFMFEKWAGPAFTNSPPPSSLPIPNFSSLKKQRPAAAVAVAAPPAELQHMIDTEAATKGLRRILNLDF